MRQTADDVKTQLDLPIHHLPKASLQSIATVLSSAIPQ
jgi:hypothetical protein